MHPEPLTLWQSTDDPYFDRRYSNTVLSQSLLILCVLVHTRFVWVLWESLAGIRFDFKCDFTPPTILLKLLLCPWMWLLLLLLLISCFSRVQLCATPEMAANQAPPSLGFPRKERWSGLPFPYTTKSLQCRTATAPAPTILRGFSAIWTWSISSQ